MNGHDWKNETAVGAPFIEDMDTQLTIAEYASRQGVSVYTVRRRIKTGVHSSAFGTWSSFHC